MKTFIKHIILAWFIVGSFTACKKGDIGPEGPQGTQGEIGEKGDKGSKGDPGNANVHTKIVKSTDLTWESTNLFGTNYVIGSVPMAQITTDIVNNGAVLVYGGFFWGEPWSALPISYYESGRTVNFSFGVKQGGVTIRLHYSNNAAPAAPGIQYKIVVIEGKAVTSAKNNGLNLDDYLAVKQFFKLTD